MVQMLAPFVQSMVRCWCGSSMCYSGRAVGAPEEHAVTPHRAGVVGRRP
jgi:hypothetical protein